MNVVLLEYGGEPYCIFEACVGNSIIVVEIMVIEMLDKELNTAVKKCFF